MKSYAASQKANNKMLRATDYTPAASWYLALLTAMPSDGAGTGMVEVPAANGYARQAIAFNAADGTGKCASSAQITFGPVVTSAWGSIVGWALYDAASGGNWWEAGAFSQAKQLDPGDTLELNAGALTIQEV